MTVSNTPKIETERESGVKFYINKEVWNNMFDKPIKHALTTNNTEHAELKSNSQANSSDILASKTEPCVESTIPTNQAKRSGILVHKPCDESLKSNNQSNSSSIMEFEPWAEYTIPTN